MAYIIRGAATSPEYFYKLSLHSFPISLLLIVNSRHVGKSKKGRGWALQPSVTDTQEANKWSKLFMASILAPFQAIKLTFFIIDFF